MRIVGSSTNFLVGSILLILGVALPLANVGQLNGEALSTLAGALIGGSILIFGNGIIELDARRRSAAAIADRRKKVVTIVTGELIGVAAELMTIKQLVDAACMQAHAGGTLPSRIGASLSGVMPLTSGLGTEILLLDNDALDALTTLQSNIAISRDELEKTLVAPAQLTMEILAKCLERIAPERKLAAAGGQPEFASVVLRSAARVSP
jgi:hypothetical protein